MHAKNLQDLFIDELKDIYDAEVRITKALPKMIKAAASEELSSAFKDHLKETQEHVTRIEQILKNLDTSPKGTTCEAMVGLLDEGEELMKEDGAPSVKDAAIIAAAQKIEHYEMATYGCLRDWARALNDDDSADILQQTLDEEGSADKRLTEIASSLNAEAASETSEDSEGEPVMARTRTGSHRPGSKTRNR
ncbi:MAG TPA: ferritin-like domain-containing protein [Candidatus Udaeobacter sp.]|nr:ferritin-like domain-containing protein [Candidatus Udaeobacter sp.]